MGQEDGGATGCKCQPSFYEIENSDAVEGSARADEQPFLCVQCPAGADCTKVGTKLSSVLPLEGFMPEVSGANTTFIGCPIPSQCKHGGGCAFSEAYEGNLCTECAEGYGRTGEWECSKCPDPALNRLYVASSAFVITMLVAIMVLSTMRAASKPKALHSILMKILMSSVQFNSLALCRNQAPLQAIV
jgi:hypothetical protein